jgi:hypothetical protein
MAWDRIRDMRAISQFDAFSVTTRQLSRRRIEIPIRKVEQRLKDIREREREFLQNVANTGYEANEGDGICIGEHFDSNDIKTMNWLIQHMKNRELRYDMKLSMISTMQITMSPNELTLLPGNEMNKIL